MVRNPKANELQEALTNATKAAQAIRDAAKQTSAEIALQRSQKSALDATQEGLKNTNGS